MKRKFFKIIIFIVITNIQFMILTSYASAQVQIVEEVFLKKTNQKIQRLLKESTEARSFLDDDLIEATEVLEKAQIKWGTSLGEIPVLYLNASGYEVSLSRYYSFKANQQNQVSLVLNILFNLKRQLEVSNSPIPQARISIFSKKFANDILMNVKTCSFSLFPFKYHNSDIKNKIANQVTKDLEKNKFIRDPKGNLTLWMGITESSDSGCNGKNQAILTLKIKFIDHDQLKTLYQGEAQIKTCRHMEDKILGNYKKLIKKLSKHFPECNYTIGN